MVHLAFDPSTAQAIKFRFPLSVFPIFILLLSQLGCGGGTGDDNKTLNICSYSKIINGTLCNQQFGPVVKLTTLDEEDNPKICSAVMVAPTKAITAWHCFDEFAFSAFVEIGQEKRSVIDLKLHPLAEVLPNGVVRNDLAIFEIESGANVPNLVSDISESEVKAKDVIEIYGFGRVDAEGTSGLLSKGRMTVSSVDNDFIRAKYDGAGQNTCYGDSGGPAFLVSGNNLELIGILSSGTNFSCAVGDESYFVNLQSPESQSFLTATPLVSP